MKTLLTFCLLLVSLCADAAFYQYQRFTTNLDGTLINGNTLTNIPGTSLGLRPGANVTFTTNSGVITVASSGSGGGGTNAAFITRTNFVSGYLYTNTNSVPLYVSAEVTVNVVGGTGTALAQLFSSSSGGVGISHFGKVATGSDNFHGTLSGWINPGENYAFTNASTGGSHTISLNPGSGRMLILTNGGGGSSLPANVALLDADQTFTGSNILSGGASTPALSATLLHVSGAVGLAGPVDFTNTVTAHGTFILQNLSGILQASSVDGTVSASISPANLPLLNSVNTFSASNNFAQVNAAGPIGSTNGYLVPTNHVAANATIAMGKDYDYDSGAATVGVGTFSSIDADRKSFATLVIVATGTITFTNDNSIHASDFAISRTLTNGNLATISFEIMPRRWTNMFFVQTK